MARKLSKAVQTPRGPALSMTTLNPYQISVQYGSQLGSGSLGIVRNTGADWFGPLNPMAPVAPTEVRGRQFDLAPGYNLIQTPRAYEPIGFAQLQALAQVYDILRIVIETRKDEVERLAWTIRPCEKDLTKKSAKIPPEMQARIDAIKSFFRKPDGVTPWGSWLRMLLEDLYVIDAPTLYKQRTRGGQLFALVPIDGSTIKRVIDDWGRTPMPYIGSDGKQVVPPAYQQVLKGLPAVNYSVRDMIYKPRNVRPGKVYGFSIVEQILMTINIGLRREMWQLSYFTEGNIPEAFIGVPDNWTPQQIKDYQLYFDAYFLGDMAARRRAKFVPGAMAKSVVQTKDPEMISAFDEWVARIVCFAFSISPQSFVKMMNRATGETAQETSEETGLQPTKQWVKSLMDGIIEEDFNSPDLHFMFEEEEEINQEAQSRILKEKTDSGRMTINEAREADGLEPYDTALYPAAAIPMVLTGSGLVPIDANTIEGKKAMMEAMPQPDPLGGGFGGGGFGGGENADQADDDEFDVDDDEIEKYSEDQPRADDGKFGEGAGDGAGEDSGVPSGGVSAKDESTIISYAGNPAAIEMNRMLRGEATSADRQKVLSQKVKALDAVIARSTIAKETQVFRGIRGVSADTLKGSVGKTMEFAAYSSTSSDQKWAGGFVKGSGDAIFVIKVPAGSKGLNVNSAMKNSANFRGQKESEILLPRGTSLRIDKLSKGPKGSTRVHATLVTK